MPKKQHVRKFLKHNGWVMYKNTDHEHYMKKLANGEILYTKLSHGKGEVPPTVWRKMLKQMNITEAEFYAGL